MDLDAAAATAGPSSGAALARPVPSVVIQPQHVVNLLAIELGKQPNLLDGGPGVSVTLQALNTGRDHNGAPQAEVACRCGDSQLWADLVAGQVSVMCGSLKFAALATNRGDLQVYSSSGRRLLPPVVLGSPVALMAADSSWGLLLACADGSMRLWDVSVPTCLVTSSLAPIITPNCEVSSLRLTPQGVPVAVLSNQLAYAFHRNLDCWLRVADDAFPASSYHSITSTGTLAQGELARLQQAAAQAQRRTTDIVAASLSQPAAWQHRQSRAHLETNMAAALVLHSPAEYRRWLITYVRQLAADADEVRLREVVDELMGPLRWTPDSHTAAPAATATSRPASSSITGGNAGGSGWQPHVLGIDKRRLLRSDVLRVINHNRANQRLVQEVMEQLKEVEVQPQQAAAAGGGACSAAPMEP